MFITNLKSIVNNFLQSKEETPEVTESELHASMHELIQRHKELLVKIKANHNLLQQMKQNEGMGRQKESVWQEIQTLRRTATDTADRICDLKVALYGDKATNL